jgi:hypothetical protein
MKHRAVGECDVLHVEHVVNPEIDAAVGLRECEGSGRVQVEDGERNGAAVAAVRDLHVRRERDGGPLARLRRDVGRLREVGGDDDVVVIRAEVVV